jgi:hypothetical protein
MRAAPEEEGYRKILRVIRAMTNGFSFGRLEQIYFHHCRWWLQFEIIRIKRLRCIIGTDQSYSVIYSASYF